MSLFYERYPLSKTPNPEILSPVVLRRALIGEGFWDASLDQIPSHLDYRWFVWWYISRMHEFGEDGWGLVFSGDFGTGKTALGCILLMEGLMRRGRSLYIRCSTMVDRLWNHKDPGLPNGASLREGLENVTFLFLDDFEIFGGKIGKGEGETGAKDRLVEEIIEVRYNKRLPTFIATNLPWERMLEIERLHSFFKQCYYPVNVTGVNWREAPPVPQTAN